MSLSEMVDQLGNVKNLPFFRAYLENGEILIEGEREYFGGEKILNKDGLNEGIYVHWNWDGKFLKVNNDRFGFYPLFYYSDKTQIIISPFILAILDKKLPVHFDYRAFAVFFRLGYFISDDTPFEEIKILPPQTELIWSREGLRINEIPFSFSRESKISYEDAVDQYIYLFRQSIRKRLPGNQKKTILPLSGGRDSRHVFLELMYQGVDIDRCISTRNYWSGGNEDCDTAAKLCRCAGISHQVVGSGSRVLKDELRNMILTSFCADEHFWSLSILDSIHDGTVIYDGIAGDSLSRSAYLNKFLIESVKLRKYQNVVNFILEKGSSDKFLENCLNKKIYEKIASFDVKDRLFNEVKKYSGTAHPASFFNFFNRARREVSLVPHAIFQSKKGISVHTPYLDHQLFDFLASVREDVQIDHDFHTDVILRAYPKFNGLSFSERGQTVDFFTKHTTYRKDLALFYLRTMFQRSNLLNKKFFDPRIVRIIFDRKYVNRNSWLISSQIAYLVILDAMMPQLFNSN